MTRQCAGTGNNISSTDLKDNANLKGGITDLEGRSCRNNICIEGLPEYIKGPCLVRTDSHITPGA